MNTLTHDMTQANVSEAAGRFDAFVNRIRRLAEGIIEISLRAVGGTEMPTYTPGAHIDIEIPALDQQGRRLVRQYSLTGDPEDRHNYVIAVSLDAQSRGGSRYLHECLREGDVLRVSAPRNHFPLNEESSLSILVAGGIGVTPLLSMARRLSTLKKQWVFYLCARTPQRAAYLEELRALPGGCVVTVFDGVPGGQSIDLSAVFDSATNDAHFYCCGPLSLMESFEVHAQKVKPSHVHVEWFKPRAGAEPKTLDQAFTLKLARSGLELTVPANKKMLDVMLDAGIDVPYSCCDGICGTCETRVLDGEPDHRDSVLVGAFGAEVETKDRILVCVSRAKSKSITLDL